MERKSTTSEINAKYQKIFRGMDDNKSGLVNVEDVVSNLRSMGNEVTENEIKETLSKITGTNQTERIVFEEFVFLMVELDMEIVENDEFALVFQFLDKDGDGFVSPEDLKELLVGMGESISEERLSAMIEEADKDGDGKVSYEDFCNVMAVQEIKCEQESHSDVDSATNSSPENSITGFAMHTKDSARMLPACTAGDKKRDSGSRRMSFAAGAKRRMSCLLFGTPNVTKNSSAFLRRPRSRSSCGNLEALHECGLPSGEGLPKGRRSFSSSPNFLKEFFKKK